MEKKYVGSLDQGTTSTRFILFSKDGNIVASHQLEHRQIYPSQGLVEHDPLEIWQRSVEVIKETLKKANVKKGEIDSIGITNQRETTILWDPQTGKPYYNAIVWQDTRTAKICDSLSKNGDMNCYKNKTGLPLATYFSGPKIKWILDNVSGIREAAKKGRVLFGNIDTWLLWNLTGGPNGGKHYTDVSNASRTFLMNINTLKWDKELLEIMDIPENILPEIRPSSEIYGYTKKDGPFEDEIPVSGILGDQQAALFGQCCFEVGEAKSTYGTGAFLLLNTGTKPTFSKHGLLTTLAYKIGNNDAIYALEGSIAMAGSLIQWVRDNLQMVKSGREIDEFAERVKDNGGVYIVPAFAGLFAPYWRKDARGVIVGLTHYATNCHLARAVLEASVYQTKDIFDAMYNDSNIKLTDLKIDGGMTVSEPFVQFLADILDVKVLRPKVRETTALGAAYAAGIATGFWKFDEIKKNWLKDKEWHPNISKELRDKYYKEWKKAVERTLNWVE